jgi:hypothetical protein
MDGFNRVLKADGVTPLLRRSGLHLFEQSLPRAVFDQVTEVVSPHQASAAAALLRLLASLLTISVFFLVIWEYQLFADVTDTSEAFLSLATVSVPRLFGIMASAGYQRVRQVRKEHCVAVIIENTTELKNNS